MLSGLLNDGTSGMSAIKQSGRIAIVQDPNEAEYPDMPFSVLNAMEVDHVVSITELGELLKELTQIRKFKCHVGHSFTERDLIKRQTEEVEGSLWYAIRSLEQRRKLLETQAARYSKTGNQFMARDYLKRKDEILGHIEILKKIIVDNLYEPDEM